VLDDIGEQLSEGRGLRGGAGHGDLPVPRGGGVSIRA
jgi:hypothetical protein